jgi:hypothetical protein
MERKAKIALGFMHVPYINEERKYTQDLSITMMGTYQGLYPVALDLNDTSSSLEGYPHIPKLNLLKRNSRRTINNTRDLPYIKDIFDILSRIECNIIGYTNSDIIFLDGAIDTLNLQYAETFLFSRVDIPFQMDFNQKIEHERLEKSHSGMDACFFKKDWWLKNRNLFPDDLIVGETEWDTIYRMIAKKNSQYIEARNVYHFKHKPQWNVSSPGAKNNINIFNQIRGKQ